MSTTPKTPKAPAPAGSTKIEIGALMSMVKEAADKLKARIADIDEQIDALQPAHDALLYGPLSKADYLAVIREDVRGRASLFRKQLLLNLENPEKVNYSRVLSADGKGLNISYLSAGNMNSFQFTEGAYYYYLEDQIVDGVERALADREWPVDAVSMADRGPALAALEAQIAELTAQREAMADELVACGVTQ